MDVKKIHNFSNKFWKINKTKGHSKYRVCGKLPVSASSEVYNWCLKNLRLEKLHADFLYEDTHARALTDVWTTCTGCVVASCAADTVKRPENTPAHPVHLYIDECLFVISSACIRTLCVRFIRNSIYTLKIKHKSTCKYI